MRFLTRLFGWALAIIVGIIAVLLMIGSREIVTVQLALVPGALEWPLFVVVLAAWVVGFFCGAIIMWFNGSDWRELARDEMVELDQARKEIDALKAELEAVRGDADRAETALAGRGTAAGNDNRLLAAPAGKALQKR